MMLILGCQQLEYILGHSCSIGNGLYCCLQACCSVVFHFTLTIHQMVPLGTGQNLWGTRAGNISRGGGEDFFPKKKGGEDFFSKKNRGADTFFRKRLGGRRLFFEKKIRGAKTFFR